MSIVQKILKNEMRWVQITRNNNNRTFTFAVGYTDEPIAYKSEKVSFVWVPNWESAKDYAMQTITI